jgi:uncharacterized protein YndB with AHSA1/START domain
MNFATHETSTVRRTVGDRTLEAGQARVQTISQVYATDVDDLWEAVTTPERIARWFLPVSGELVEGGKYSLEGNASGTVTKCDRPRFFAATWEFNGQVSWIEVRLTAEPEGGSRFELEHVAHVDDEFWEQYGPGATGIGWDLALLGLGMHVKEPGSAIDPRESEAWTLSPEGKAYLRTLADAWAEAAIAAGQDAASARAAADRSYAFYTGS